MMTSICKKIVSFSSVILFLNSIVAVAAVNHRIMDYHQTFFPCSNRHGDLRIAIRTYYFDATPYYLVVNPRTFATEAAPAVDYKPRKKMSDVPGYFTMRELLQTPYINALMKYTSPPYKLQNYGITHSEKPVDELFLTVDMCPAAKRFEACFFHCLVSMAEKNHRPMPISLSVTGLWIIGHPNEFNWLIKQANENKLKIIWVNHSFSHVYYEDLPLKKNFLLNFQTNTTHEILATEKLLLEHGQLPSVFFRFPGLVSNKKLALKLRKYGLIPIGADAWLAKDQEPKSGSFILVHGNSNEPQGIKKLMPLLQDSRYRWLSLDKAFVQRS